MGREVFDPINLFLLDIGLMDNSNREQRQRKDGKTQWDRESVVKKVVDFEGARQRQSQRQWAEGNGIARTTLQYWLSRKRNLDASPIVIQFFESPEGLAFLHRLVCAVHFEFVECGVGSIHNVCNFLKLCGLSAFVASSYGAQQKVSKDMDTGIIEFAQMEQGRLSAQMPKKRICICEDETFHPDVCLVAMEPVSNFILLEEYAPDRTAKTWNESIKKALSELPVEVIQSTSDEGRGLLKHIKEGLQANHSPDSFHVLYEISKGTSGALASSVKQAEKEYREATERTQKEKKDKEQFDSRSNRPRGRRPSFEKRIAAHQAHEQQMEEKLQEARQNQEAVKDAKARISQVYHPYDPLTGTKQDAETMATLLRGCFDEINKATEFLSDRSKKHIEKAYRVVNDMKASIAFFFCMISIYLKSIDIQPEVQRLMYEFLIPGFYLQKVASRERNQQRKENISQKSAELLSILYKPSGILAACEENQLRLIEKAAKECAQLFQPSSSCVEGRNAQLSLYHHGLHRLSDRKLQALTSVHNYYKKRTDGTTPSERFFGGKPKDMFEWLLDHINLPARPRKSLAKAA